MNPSTHTHIITISLVFKQLQQQLLFAPPFSVCVCVCVCVCDKSSCVIVPRPMESAKMPPRQAVMLALGNVNVNARLYGFTQKRVTCEGSDHPRKIDRIMNSSTSAEIHTGETTESREQKSRRGLTVCRIMALVVCHCNQTPPTSQSYKDAKDWGGSKKKERKRESKSSVLDRQTDIRGIMDDGIGLCFHFVDNLIRL